jgi:hypothetical protein
LRLPLGSTTFIPYLAPGRYHGLDPHYWLIREGIERQLGNDIIRIKQPHFYNFEDFPAERCGTHFDYIMAHSIFSHAGSQIIANAIDGFRHALSMQGLALFTVLLKWHNLSWSRIIGLEVPPRRQPHSRETIDALIANAGLTGRILKAFHPHQTWYIVARDAAYLPERALDVLFFNGVIHTPNGQSRRGLERSERAPSSSGDRDSQPTLIRVFI